MTHAVTTLLQTPKNQYIRAAIRGVSRHFVYVGLKFKKIIMQPILKIRSNIV